MTRMATKRNPKIAPKTTIYGAIIAAFSAFAAACAAV
jgi:CDP-diglyceride synthetase